MNDSTIIVNEIFTSIQGEGPDLGRPAVFLRLQGCPVQCAGCDTAYAWRPGETSRAMSYIELALALERQHAPTRGLVLTGGEPLLHYQSAQLRVLLNGWWWTGLETSGFAYEHMNPVDLFIFLDHFNTVCLSPKITPCLPGKPPQKMLESAMRHFSQWREGAGHGRKLYLKFVVRNEVDVNAVVMFLARHQFSHVPVYLMPYGNNRDEILRTVEAMVPLADRYGFRITPRLHSLLWGARRGV